MASGRRGQGCPVLGTACSSCMNRPYYTHFIYLQSDPGSSISLNNDNTFQRFMLQYCRVCGYNQVYSLTALGELFNSWKKWSLNNLSLYYAVIDLICNLLKMSF